MDCTKTDLGCIPNDPLGFAGQFYGIGLSIIGAVVVISIVYGGYLIMTSGDNPRQLDKGKSYIIYAIVGLFLAILGLVIIQVVAVDVLGLPGFSK